MIRTDILSRQDSFEHGFFTRQGGHSDGVYGSLNCGYGSGDHHATVRSNRETAMAMFGRGADDLTTVFQVHGAEVAVVERPWALDDRPQADAMVTRSPGVALGILTADCAPVLFADAEAGVIGAAHAGWQGALKGILEATVRAMENMGADRRRTVAALGPCIRQKSYEVGPEFEQRFIDADSANRRHFEPSERPDHHMFDLAGYVLNGLRKLDLGGIDDVDVDTYEDEERFFSYRRTTHRGEKDYGRGLSAIVLVEK